MTASATHSTALAAIEAALEVEAAATPGPWEATTTGGWPHHNYVSRADAVGVAMQYGLVWEATDADLIVLARALVRRSLLNAKETLEQHRPADDPNYCGGGHLIPSRWPCPDAQRALALVNDIPEGGAK